MKFKTIKRVISFVLAILTVLTMSGFSVICGTLINGINNENAPYETIDSSFTLDTSDHTVIVPGDSISSFSLSENESSYTSNFKDYLKQVGNPHILSINDIENVDLSTCSLNLNYSVSNLDNISLTLMYSSSSSSKYDKLFRSNGCIEYYMVYVLNEYNYVQCDNESNAFSRYEIRHVFFADSITEALQISSMYDENMISFTYMDTLDGISYYCEEVDNVVTISEVVSPITSSISKNLTPRENGLGAGWYFNIPAIETLNLPNINDDTIDTSNKIIHLDNGMSLSLDSTGLKREREDYIFENNILTYKDGTKYTFDSNGKCLSKEDRYGKQIRYIYNEDNKLIRIEDDNSKFINVRYNYSNIVITDSYGNSSSINTSGTTYENKLINSLSLNNETYTFSYEIGATTASCSPVSTSVNIDNVLLNKVTYPNGDYSAYTYDIRENPWGLGSSQSTVISSRYDYVLGNVVNQRNYINGGSSEFVEDDDNIENIISFADIMSINDTNELIRAKYLTSIVEGNLTKTYFFNEWHLCIGTNTLVNGSLYEESINYYDEYRNLTYTSNKTYSNDRNTYLMSYSAYENDNRGNVTFYIEHADSVLDLNKYTTVLYDDIYNQVVETYIPKDEQVVKKTINTLSQDSKSIVRTDIYENDTLVTYSLYSYDSNGNLISSTNSENVTTYYGYDSYNYVNEKRILDKVYSYTNDQKGNVLLSRDPLGNETTYTYDVYGRLNTVTYPNGSFEEYVYSNDNTTVTLTNRMGYVLTLNYDILGNILNINDSSCVLESYTYDNRGNISSVLVDSLLTTYIYDDFDRVISKTSRDNRNNQILSQTLYSYDVEDNLYVKTVTVVGDSNSPSIVTKEYANTKGDVVKTRIGNIEETFVYDLMGNRIGEHLASGNVNIYTYDIFGKETLRVDSLNSTYQTEYNSEGLKTKVIDPNGNITRFNYDGYGNLIEQVEGNGRVSTYTYDLNGNILSKDIEGTITNYTYDNMGRLTLVSSHGLVDSYVYDNNDKVVSQSIGTINTIFTYDIKGNLTSSTDGLGHTEYYVYDNFNNNVSKTDKNGNVINYTYDSLCRLLTTTSGSQYENRVYTLTGKIRSISNNTSTLTYTYDNLGNIVSEVENDNIDTFSNVYTYDSANRKATYRQYINGALKNYQSYHYDIIGRMINVCNVEEREIEEPDPDPDPEPNPEPEPDAISVVTFSGITFNVYECDNIGNENNRIYLVNIFGNYSYMTCNENYYGIIEFGDNGFSGTVYHNGKTITIGEEEAQSSYILSHSSYVSIDGFNDFIGKVYIDNRGNKYIKVEPNIELLSNTTEIVETPIVEYAYDANGNRIREVRENIVTNYTFNELNQVILMTNTDIYGNILSSYINEYYTNGNLKKTIEGNTTKEYTYDILNRVISERITVDGNVETITYTYDSNSNRQSKTENGSITTYVYDNVGRLTSETSSLKVISYVYDFNGNIVSVFNNLNLCGSYTYDIWNRQISYTNSGINYIYYTYRADGYRHSAGDKKHMWEGSNIVANIGLDVTIYVRGLTLIYSENEDKVSYLFNSHGDVIKLIQNGVVVKEYDYDAFGIEKNEDEDDTNPFRYCSEYYDKETKTIYLRARYYNPSTGRFTTEDDRLYTNQQEPLTLNLYTYCHNNPLIYIDPTGHVGFLAAVLIGSFIGAAIGLANSIIDQVVTIATSEEKDWDEFSLAKVAVSAVAGAITGAVSVCGIPPVVAGIINGVVSAAESVANDIIDNNDSSYDNDHSTGQIIANAIYSGATGFLFGYVSADSSSAKIKKHPNAGRRAMKKLKYKKTIPSKPQYSIKKLVKNMGTDELTTLLMKPVDLEAKLIVKKLF